MQFSVGYLCLGFILALSFESGKVSGAPYVPTTERCGENMKYNECGTSCPKTCENKDDELQICNFMCNQGCFCEEGFVLASDAPGAPCIPEKDCQTCPENMEYNECGTSCPTTCQNKDDEFQICNFMCNQGCFCKEGFVLASDAPGAPCIPEKDCQTCPENMEYNECGTSCPTTCQNKDDQSQRCNFRCNPGCVCKEGYVLASDAPGAPCVPEEKCNNNNCPENMEHKECGSSCPDFCGAPAADRICTANCVQGCFCKEGYILASNTTDAQCIPKEECCAEKMEFKFCGSACPDYCGAPKIRKCTRNCVIGCFCKPGYVLENKKNGAKCVPSNECSIN